MKRLEKVYSIMKYNKLPKAFSEVNQGRYKICVRIYEVTGNSVYVFVETSLYYSLIRLKIGYAR